MLRLETMKLSWTGILPHKDQVMTGKITPITGAPTKIVHCGRVFYHRNLSDIEFFLIFSRNGQLAVVIQYYLVFRVLLAPRMEVQNKKGFSFYRFS